MLESISQRSKKLGEKIGRAGVLRAVYKAGLCGSQKMDLPYALKLLAAADEQRHGFIKLRGARADHEVRLMAEAGLVEATLNDGQPGSFTSINRLTDLGETFLRAFRDQSIPASTPVARRMQFAAEWRSDFPAAIIHKWRVNFSAGPPRFRQAAA